jgi:hypothetical protein
MSPGAPAPQLHDGAGCTNLPGGRGICHDVAAAAPADCSVIQNCG